MCGRLASNPDEVWLFDPLKHYHMGGEYSHDSIKVEGLGDNTEMVVLPQKFDAVIFVKTTTIARLDPGIERLQQQAEEAVHEK